MVCFAAVRGAIKTKPFVKSSFLEKDFESDKEPLSPWHEFCTPLVSVNTSPREHNKNDYAIVKQTIFNLRICKSRYVYLNIHLTLNLYQGSCVSFFDWRLFATRSWRQNVPLEVVRNSGTDTVTAALWARSVCHLVFRILLFALRVAPGQAGRRAAVNGLKARGAVQVKERGLARWNRLGFLTRAHETSVVTHWGGDSVVVTHVAVMFQVDGGVASYFRLGFKKRQGTT